VESNNATQLIIDAEIDLSVAQVQLVRADHPQPRDYEFRRDDVYWIDLCLTPRRPNAVARYANRWGSHRFAELGAIMALPAGEQMHLRSAGGRHASVICQLDAQAVVKWLPGDFRWSDRQLEACLHIASDSIQTCLLRLNQELRYPALGTREICHATVVQLGVELARYILSIDERPERGGLAAWRLRLIDRRLAELRAWPTLRELATLCKLSERQLARGFQVSRGCSIGVYLAQNRIETAKRRLASSESIKEIALSLGYATQSGFTFAFRRATGTTPSQYQKSFGSERRLTRPHTTGSDRKS
jgi:AraC family transcriptional regulator